MITERRRQYLPPSQFRLTKETELVEITGTERAIARGYTIGRTWVCTVCGTCVREGQLHRTDVYPAHASIVALRRVERLPAPDGRPVLPVNA